MAQVEALLADAAKAAESWNKAALAAAFEGGSSYPRRDLERFKEAEFWKLRPGRRIKRLGPDAFEVPLSPRKADASSTSEGPISLSTNLRLPVRVGSDRRLKIMPVDEARRLEEALASASADPAPTVELLMLPDEDSWLWGAGHHFASEFWVTTAGDQTTFRIRFDPPLVGPSLRADVPPPQGAGWLGEMGVDLTLDADGDPATGTLESKVHQEAGGSWPALTPPGAAEFGIDRVLKVYGKKFDAGGGTKAWSIRVELTDFFAEVVRRDAEVTIRSGGKQTLLELRHPDPRIKIEGDLLRVTVPVSVAGVRPGGSYRVRLGNNSGFSDSRDIVVHKGKVQTP